MLARVAEVQVSIIVVDVQIQVIVAIIQPFNVQDQRSLTTVHRVGEC
jgi:hypothetical protein